MHIKTHYKLAALLLVLAAPFSLTYAAKSVVKEYSFDLADIEKIDVNASVGSVHIMHTTARKASVVLEIRQQNTHWFKSDIDLNEVELDSHVRGKRLVLRQNDDDLNIDWTIELPNVEETSVELGVGQIEGKLGDTKVHIKLGVGDVDLDMPLESAGEIELKTGVGDARLRGGSSKEYKKRSFVSQDVEGHGDGENSVYVKVGVGGIKLNLEHAKL